MERRKAKWSGELCPGETTTVYDKNNNNNNMFYYISVVIHGCKCSSEESCFLSIFSSCVCRLEGELGEDWRILGDVSSLPRRTKHALKPKNEETQNILEETNHEENYGRFGTEPGQQTALMKRSLCKEELLPTTRKTNWQSNSNPGEEVKRENCLPPSSSIAFLEKLLKDRRSEGKARTVTFGEYL